MPRRFLPFLLCCLLLLTACKTELYTKVGEREANEMIAALLRAGIPAERKAAKDGTSTVSVDADRIADAVEILRAHQLPRPQFASMGEVFAQQGLVSTPTEERARFIHALSQELARTISDVDGVLSARIHVVLPRNDLLRQDASPSAASIFVRHDARAPLGEIAPQLKMLVANSIEGLAYERVSLVLLPVERPGPLERDALPGTTRSAAPQLGTAAASLVGGALAGALSLWFFLRRRGGLASPGRHEAPDV